MTYFADLYNLSEDDRIRAIGTQATAGKKIAVALEADQPLKAQRYIEKVESKYPKVMLLERRPGLTAQTITLIFGLRKNYR